MIKYEQLPPSAQKAYNFTSKVRTVTMFIGLAAGLIMFILSFNVMFNGKDNFFTVFGGSLMFGGFLHGVVHMEFALKKLWRSLGIIAIIPCLFVIMIGAYIGFILMIVDLILFIMKKPRIYPFEHKYFLYSEEAQVELILNENITDELEQLKELLNKGLISEEDYNKKKDDILNRL